MRTPSLACLLKHLGCKHTVVAIAFSNSLLCGQTESTKLNELVRLEREKPTVLTYSQLSIYDKGEAVQYKGIVYLHIDSVTTQECILAASVTVQDRYVAAEDRKKGFAGKVIHKETGEIIDTYHYKYTINLKEISPAAITTIIGRPFQLADDTRLSCSEAKACNPLDKGGERVTGGLRDDGEKWLRRCKHQGTADAYSNEYPRHSITLRGSLEDCHSDLQRQ